MNPEPAEPARTRVRIDLAYDGTDFRGWARQPGLRTVQGELEAALAAILARSGPAPTVTVAGRTDVGVHAVGQVAHVDLTADQLERLAVARRGERSAPDAAAAVRSLVRRVNGIAGAVGDVRLRAAEIAPPGFDARFAAIWRRYEYRIADALAAQDPRLRRSTVWLPRPLDVDAMDAAAGSLLGLHDFASFCKPREGATTIRALQEFRWRRADDGVLVAELRADAFCHSMVRALVGACVAAGEARYPVARVAELRDRAERTAEFKVLPAHGLTLVEVGYPPDAELAARTAQTRAKRSAEVTE